MQERHTLAEWYRIKISTYYLMLDSKGKFKEGKGLVPMGIIKETEKIMKDHITSRRKTDLYLRVLYSNDNKRIFEINPIRQYEYNRITGWENL